MVWFNHLNNKIKQMAPKANKQMFCDTVLWFEDFEL